MKNLPVLLRAKYFAMTLFALLVSFVVMAQEETKKVEVDIDAGKDDTGMFGSPWIWIVGVAVFILLLVALMRGGRRRD